MSDLAVLRDATIVFDLDGTLVDSAPDLISSLNAILEANGYGPLEAAVARPLIARGARRLLEHGLMLGGVVDPEARAADLFPAFLDHYRDHIADYSQPYPGAIDALRTLRAAGAKVAVCSNKPTQLARVLLAKLSMAESIDTVLGPDAVSAMKPNPSHLLETIAAAGGDPSRTIMIGDAPPDAAAARGAGTFLIIVDFGYTEVPAADLEPDVLLGDFHHLIESCCQLLAKNKGREN